MKKYLGLIIPNAALLAIYVHFYLIVQFFYYGYWEWGDFLVISFLFTSFLYMSMIAMSIFVLKEKKFIIPLIVFVIYEWGISLYKLLHSPSYWLYIVCFVLINAILALTIILLVFLKPFSTETNTSPVGCKSKKTKRVSFDDIFKAKELLDCGAITQEEFDDIKGRIL